MSTSIGSELSELIPLALVIAFSPLSIIPAVLILQSPRPRPAGLAFLLGWVAGLATVTLLFVGVSGLVGGMGNKPPTWASWLRIVVGAALVVFGIYRWLSRHHKPHQMPGTSHFTEAGPAKGLVVGAALTVLNPKVLFICSAAGLAIGTSGLGREVGVAVAAFVAVSASTVALPILAYAMSGDRLEPALERLGAEMEKRNAAMVAAILLIIGSLVLYKGIHGL